MAFPKEKRIFSLRTMLFPVKMTRVIVGWELKMGVWAFLVIVRLMEGLNKTKRWSTHWKHK